MLHVTKPSEGGETKSSLAEEGDCQMGERGPSEGVFCRTTDLGRPYPLIPPDEAVPGIPYGPTQRRRGLEGFRRGASRFFSPARSKIVVVRKDLRLAPQVPDGLT